MRPAPHPHRLRRHRSLQPFQARHLHRRVHLPGEIQGLAKSKLVLRARHNRGQRPQNPFVRGSPSRQIAARHRRPRRSMRAAPWRGAPPRSRPPPRERATAACRPASPPVPSPGSRRSLPRSYASAERSRRSANESRSWPALPRLRESARPLRAAASGATRYRPVPGPPAVRPRAPGPAQPGRRSRRFPVRPAPGSLLRLATNPGASRTGSDARYRRRWCGRRC